jgi:hypothetical protein
MKNHLLPKIAAATVALMAAVALVNAQPAAVPKVGDKAPLVTGKDQDGKTWKLENSATRNLSRITN